MKKFILSLSFCLVLTGSSYAQNNTEAMRFLMVNAMMEYGQKLYDRGDFNEACAVFNHVLIYNSHQAQALEFLKEMGHLPISMPSSNSSSTSILVLTPTLSPGPLQRSQVSGPSVSVRNNIVVEKFDLETLKSLDVSDPESLKKAIEVKRKIVAKLRAQITQMRANLASESTQE